MVVLGYIKNETRRFRIVVANRVRKIRDNTNKNQWKYISTSENPGDDASRGLAFDDEVKIDRWFNGHFINQNRHGQVNPMFIQLLMKTRS